MITPPASIPLSELSTTAAAIFDVAAFLLSFTDFGNTRIIAAYNLNKSLLFFSYCRDIHLVKFPAADNFADITTKPSTGDLFIKHLAPIFGIPLLTP